MSTNPATALLAEIQRVDPAAHARLVASIEAILSHQPIPCHIDDCTHTAAADDLDGLQAHIAEAHPIGHQP